MNAERSQTMATSSARFCKAQRPILGLLQVRWRAFQSGTAQLVGPLQRQASVW